MTNPVPLLQLDARQIVDDFDVRPFGFQHQLHRLDLLSVDALHRLAQRMVPSAPDWFVASGQARPDTRFYSVDNGYLRPHEAIEQLDRGTHRILLKRAENHDPRYRELVDTLFRQIIDARGGLYGERVVRLETGIFISSGAATTPFHFDPEINFFSQIEGDKEYHVYAPPAVSEPELENFFVHGQHDIAQIPLAGRDPAYEQVFALSAGLGLHQPHHSPHWVRTGATRSISFSMVWETDRSRALGRARACNYYLRRLGLSPTSPGSAPRREAVKASAMQVLTPIRKAAVAVKRSLVSR